MRGGGEEEVNTIQLWVREYNPSSLNVLPIPSGHVDALINILIVRSNLINPDTQGFS